MSTTSNEITNIITSAVLSDNVKAAWSKLVSDLCTSTKTAVADIVGDLREGVSEITAVLKSDLQKTGGTIETDIQKQFAAFLTSSSASMDTNSKAAYLAVMNAADNKLTTIITNAVNDVWKEAEDISGSLNKILDSALNSTTIDAQALLKQVASAFQNELGDLASDLKNDVVTNYQATLSTLASAATAAGLLSDKTAITNFANNVVSVVAADITSGSAQIVKDVTSEVVEMTSDLTATITKDGNSLIKTVVNNVANVVNTIVSNLSSAWKKIKSIFHW